MANAKRRIPYCVPSWGWPEHLTIFKVLLMGRIVAGPHIQALYETVRSMTGVPFVFGFDSGASAIRACLSASGIGLGDEVIMPSFCCHSVAEAIVRCGAAPIFCEIQADLNPDVGSILALLKPSVKAIVFPHLFGRPGEIALLEEQLYYLGVRERIVLIDDAAQSFGARIQRRYLGSFGDAGIISFGAGKMTTASGGGLLLIHSEDLARRIAGLAVEPPGLVDKLRDLAYWTIFRRWRKYSSGVYRYVAFLLKSALDPDDGIRGLADIDAAIALSQIERLEELMASRRSIRKMLDHVFAEIQQARNVPIERLPAPSDGRQETYNKQIFFFDNTGILGAGPCQFNDYMKQSGIELQSLYAPLHREPRFRRPNTELLFTERRAATALNLCTDPTLSQKDLAHICATVTRYFEMLHRDTASAEFQR